MELFLDEEERSIEEDPEQEENKNEGDGNNTPIQRKLGLDISMIGASEEKLGRSRSQTQEMSSPRNESMEKADLTMEDWIQRNLPDLSCDSRTNRTQDVSRGMALSK